MTQDKNNSSIYHILNATGKVFLGSEVQATWGKNQIRALEVSLTTEIFGFVLSSSLVKTLSHLNINEINTIGEYIINQVKKSTGGHHEYLPMYPNFPAQVIDASEEELLLNACVHYLGSWLGLLILPNYKKIARKIIEKNPNPRLIDICTEKYLHDYVGNMLSANVSYSPAQCEDLSVIAKFLQENQKLDNIIMNAEIPNKENLAFWGNLYVSKSLIFNKIIAPHFTTTTDVLRLIVAYSIADTSLAKTLRVAKMSRPVRKLFMNLLEKVCNSSQDKEQVIENLLKYRSEWVRIAHAMHIGEYAKKYKTSYDFLSKLRNNERIITFNSVLEDAYFHGDSTALIENLKKRPGVFARNLTRLLVTKKGSFDKGFSAKKKKPGMNKYKENVSLFNDNATKQLSSLAVQLSKLNIQDSTVSQDNVQELVDTSLKISQFMGVFTNEQRNSFISSFEEVVSSVSTPVLLQVHSHFKNIENKMNLAERAIMPKGGFSKIFLQSGSTPKYELNDCKRVEIIVENALTNRFSELPNLGKVYVSPDLKTQNIPFAMRSASKALKTVARGSSFSLDVNDNNIRMFLWWKNLQNITLENVNNRVDIDLSVSLYGDDFECLGHCGYWNLRVKGMTHSGDITTAPNGACEFIDIDKSLIDKNVAYIVTSLTSYTGQKYCDLPECFAGWIEKRDLNEGEIFDARNVKNKIDLSSDTTNIIPVVYDVRNNRMIWIDTAYGKSAIFSNAANTSDAIGMVLQSWVKMQKPTLYDLFNMHAKARGQLVDTPQEAEHVFSIHEGVTPYDFDVITAEYMMNSVVKE